MLADALVARMHAHYTACGSLAATAAEFGGNRQSLREVFVRRGLWVREAKTVPRLSDGRFPRARKLSARSITKLIESATRIMVPAPLKCEWRKWPLRKRAQFIRRLRGHLQLPGDRPKLPFAAGMRAFDYGTAEAHRIAARENQSRNSQTGVIKLKVASQGVIWRGRLWFWMAGTGYQLGVWRPCGGRPTLHHAIWEESHGRPVPEGHVLRFRDGNPNNLVPSNLVLVTRDAVCRENQASALTQRSRAITAHLLKQNRGEGTHYDTVTMQLRGNSRGSR